MLIAITGGIGAGKSVVSNILRCMGYPVYDCDSSARAIMDSDSQIKSKIAERISADALTASGALDRGVISAVVFGNPEKLAELNSIVHGAVRSDLMRWVASLSVPLAFVETAILYQSGLDRLVDAVWDVTAPEHVRIPRVCRRNSLSPEQVKARIASQKYKPECPHPLVSTIINDDCHSLLLQIHNLLAEQLTL